MRRTAICFVTFACSLSAALHPTTAQTQHTQAPTPPNRGGLAGGGPTLQHESCIPPALQASIRADIDAYLAVHPVIHDRADTGPFQHYPQGAVWQRDLSFGLFMDHDATSGIRSYDCGTLTYDTHAGCDSGTRTFAETAIGVPVFAALDGVVVARSDGYPDQNTQPDGSPGNYIILSHPGDMETWYFHLRNGSGLPALGSTVDEGQQIGLTGSSGYSYGPHLHFQVMWNGQPYDPFAGACNATGLWNTQPTYSTATSITDAAFSHIDLATVPGNPHDVPRTGQLALTDNLHWVWIQVQNLPANNTFRFRYIRPSGTVAYESPVWPFNNPEFYGRAWYWFNWWIADMHTITGTWRAQIELNGTLHADMPVEVRPARTPDLNRAPLALQSAQFDPGSFFGHALYCSITSPLVVDDPDYDVVRYRYLWTRNGSTVRDVTTAGHADACRADLFSPGDLVTCTVTPMDALLSGPPTTASMIVGQIGNACDSIDFNNDGLFPDTLDIDDLLSVFSGGPCSNDPNCNDIDYNNDGLFPDTMDIDSLLSVFSGGPCI